MGPTDRVVVLIDMDCFYCQVEEKLDPQLAGQPIAVVQYNANAWRGGGIIAVNYPARNEGVTRHMRGDDARKKCPRIKLVQVPAVRGKADLTKYRDAGKEVADVLAAFTPLLERASVDEAYLDITEQVESRIRDDLTHPLTCDKMGNTFVVGHNTPDFIDRVTAEDGGQFCEADLRLAIGGLITEEIRAKVYEVTGYRCSAGVAHNKILSKLVCGLHKPNKQTILPQSEVVQLFDTLPIGKITSLGGKFGQSLVDDLGIKFMGELAKISQKDLVQKYDEKNGLWLYNIARGIDLEPVKPKLISKSIACCKQFLGKSALTNSQQVGHWLHELSEEISERLVKDMAENNRRAKQVIVSFAQQDMGGRDVSSSRTHPLSSYDVKRIAQAALDVVNRFCLRSDGSYCVKSLGLSASNFEDLKNVRAITSFFKTSGGSSGDAADSVYSELTQELIEDVDKMVFYDDSCRVKSINPVDDEPSFFKDYFKSAATKKLLAEVVDVKVRESEVCPDCQKDIPLEDFESHRDYHFALILSKSDDVAQVSTSKVVTPPLPINGKKRKQDVKNQVLINFIKKSDDDIDGDLTEICSECNKRVKLEDFGDHVDYHVARRVHLEINSMPQNNKSPVKSTSSRRKTSKNNSKGSRCDKSSKGSNSSVLSFFKPV